MGPTHLDVLVVGAGLSGVGMAARLSTLCPDHTYAVLEARAVSGGTWDLFRYPGVRSDSDMYTLSYPFQPWTDPKSLADGPAILRYIRETSTEYGVEDHVRYRHRVTRAAWASETSTWTVTAQTPDGEATFTAGFLYLAVGYYDYDRGHEIDLPGREDFAGAVVHPQHWPEDLDVTGRRVVVVGSGATAVTLVPALAERGAASVTMLQRSPTYLAVLPREDRVGALVHRLLPDRPAHRVMRVKHLAYSLTTYAMARRLPGVSRRAMARGLREHLPEGYDVATHLTPAYDPWDQRVCVVPDADLLREISRGRVEIVTDHLERLTATGMRLRSGRELPADVVVTATGLRLLVGGGATVEVDGEVVDPHERHVYKGALLEGVPNLALCMGYTNNSWTLRADLTATYVCRLLRHLRDRGWASATPRFDEPPGPPGPPEPILNLTSGYIRRGIAALPVQGRGQPWRVRQNYLLDWLAIRTAPIEDGRLELAPRRAAAATAAATAATATAGVATETAATAAAAHVEPGVGAGVPGP
ncbi:MAG TPA: NAD(P)/FAD-dependent oxidoreductase [Dermatophilaceae bacterium]|nr:NAD(P)/FAD-dependent oxidoreductase [Dermatophilaceae bacterium]